MTDATTINPGIRGQTRSTWRDETHLRGVLIRLIAQYPNASRDDLEEKYLAKAKRVPALVDEALRRAFDNDLNGVQRPAQRSRAAVAAAAAAHADVVRHIVLLDLMQANGKLLGDCTKAELKQMHGANAKLIARLSDRGTVREQFSEEEVAGILAGR
jgi:hypothetical protein